MKHALLFFIDGLGINPAGGNRRLAALLGEPIDRVDAVLRLPGMSIIPADATLGVAGLPQSATGQTALFCGINAAQLLGHHASAFPPPRLVEMIRADNIYLSLARRGLTTASANLYGRAYFELHDRHSVSTHALLAAGTEVRMSHLWRDGYAVSMDITNALMHERDPGVPVISPEQAAANLLGLLAEHHFVFFEYFLTDITGHARDEAKLDELFEILGRLFRALRHGLPLGDDHALMVVSDHGNCEDPGVGTHTMNPVPFVVVTPDESYRGFCEQQADSIVNIKKCIERFFDGVGEATTNPVAPAGEPPQGVP